MKLERIYLKEAATLLDKDIRTVKTLAERKGITIFSDSPNGSKYMSRVQFDYARNETIIKDFKYKYGDRWLEAFEAHMKIDLVAAIKLGERKGRTEKVMSNSYQPTQKEIQILSRLTGKSSEL